MMDVTAGINGRVFRVDIGRPRDISIPMQFDGDQPNAYDVEPARARAYEGGGFIGDTRRGGSCNFETVTLNTHCNGTHTECVGHISLDRISVLRVLTDAFLPATLVTITPEPALNSSDSYVPAKEDEDRIITVRSLQAQLRDADQDFLEAIIIRTSPNSEAKLRRRYSEVPAPFFSIDAVQFLVVSGVRHLLVDIPSLDRAHDQGLLSAHRAYWDVPAGSHDISSIDASARTITELVFVPDDVPDGRCILNLQVAPFASDASPSRPILFPVEPMPPKT